MITLDREFFSEVYFLWNLNIYESSHSPWVASGFLEANHSHIYKNSEIPFMGIG